MVTRGVFVALGSNLGNRAGNIRAALAALRASDGVRVLRASSLHDTEPVGGPAGQPRYLNSVVEIETARSPHDLLARLHEIEHALGRVRGERNGPRTIDLDLLLFGESRIDDDVLEVPHPRMWQRDFVLAPLRELLPAARLRALERRLSRAAGADRAPEGE